MGLNENFGKGCPGTLEQQANKASTLNKDSKKQTRIKAKRPSSTTSETPHQSDAPFLKQMGIH